MTVHTLCWVPTWSRAGLGLEHVLVTERRADSALLAIDEDGVPFRLAYRLRWDDAGLLREADLEAVKGERTRTLSLRADGRGRWWHADGAAIAHLDGCLDIDIWPTPLTNSFPIWRSRLGIGQREAYRMAWVAAPDLDVVAQPQAYTRLEARLYVFENLDGSGFTATLPVDEAGFVTDYPELFRRVDLAAAVPG